MWTLVGDMALKFTQTSSTEWKQNHLGWRELASSRQASWEEEQLIALWAGKLTAGHLQQYYSRPCSKLFSVKLSSLYAVLGLTNRTLARKQWSWRRSHTLIAATYTDMERRQLIRRKRDSSYSRREPHL